MQPRTRPSLEVTHPEVPRKGHSPADTLVSASCQAEQRRQSSQADFRSMEVRDENVLFQDTKSGSCHGSNGQLICLRVHDACCSRCPPARCRRRADGQEAPHLPALLGRPPPSVPLHRGLVFHTCLQASGNDAPSSGARHLSGEH